MQPGLQHSIVIFLCSFFLSAGSINAQESSDNQSGLNATILFDAFGRDTSLLKGWGYAVLITYKGKNILFDGGSNADVLKHNFSRKGIDPKHLDIVVVSHSHYDHINGIDYILKENASVKIYFPFDPFWGADNIFDARGQDSLVKDSIPGELRYFDGTAEVFPVPQSGGRFWNANIEYVKDSKEIVPGIKLIVSSAQYMGYFSRYPKSFTQIPINDACSDLKLTNLAELSLSLTTAKGQALFVGCSHSGVEKIVEQTKHETGKAVDFLMGGFHLNPFNRQQTQEIISFLKDKSGVKYVAPGHCTGHLAFKLLKDNYRQQFLYAGLGEVIQY